MNCNVISSTISMLCWLSIQYISRIHHAMPLDSCSKDRGIYVQKYMYKRCKKIHAVRCCCCHAVHACTLVPCTMKMYKKMDEDSYSSVYKCKIKDVHAKSNIVRRHRPPTPTANYSNNSTATRLHSTKDRPDFPSRCTKIKRCQL